jgi:hypothetical protein
VQYEQEEPEFRPIRITLETKEEAELLAASLAMVAAGKAGTVVYDIYRQLVKDVPDWRDSYQVVGDVLVSRKGESK